MKTKNLLLDTQEKRRQELERLVEDHTCTMSLTEYGPEGCICIAWMQELNPEQHEQMEEPY